jgi:hypothetical protein
LTFRAEKTERIPTKEHEDVKAETEKAGKKDSLKKRE